MQHKKQNKYRIIRTTINACRDCLRTGFWKSATEIDNADGIESPKASEFEILDYVLKLPKNYRISIYLYYYEGYTVKEIAGMLGKTESIISATYIKG